MIGIIDYGAGNIRSVGNALDRLGVEYFISSAISELERAEKLILPGVGEARSAMESLDRSGLIAWLKTVQVPFLGICIGMQILFEHSSERDTKCLGVVPGSIRRFSASQTKVPHMGWNQVTLANESNLFQGIRSDEFFYFVHSYFAPVTEHTIGVTAYGGSFSAAVQKGNYYGVQFHAEKSGNAGLQLLKNFIQRC
ncbi:MAG TPA: imidazole glycerol phosphate synthase subunit HisH [Bacteroidetes bacterium]|nr:imidazole glycerol phosphate synthase subunit HisH [Bacteroidota bacterium]